MSQPQITAETLKSKLETALGAKVPQIEDLSGGCGQMFAAVIVSDTFEGQSRLARNRAVNGALREEIAAIHAWSAKCFTPREWEGEVAKRAESEVKPSEEEDGARTEKTETAATGEDRTRSVEEQEEEGRTEGSG